MTPIILKIITASTLVVLIPKLVQYWPAISGMVGVMPTLSLLFFVCTYFENGKEKATIYTQGAAIGMIPAALLYVAIFFGLRNGLDVGTSVGLGMGVWVCSACLYQILLGNVA